MTKYARSKGDPDWIWKGKTKGAITPIDITKVKVELPPVIQPPTSLVKPLPKPPIAKKPTASQAAKKSPQLDALEKPEDVPDFLYDSMLYHKRRFTAAEYPKVKKGIEDKFTKLADYRSKDLLSAETRSYYSGQYATLNKKVRSGAQLAADDAHKISRIGDDLAALKDDHVVFRGLQYSKDIRGGEAWVEDGITSWSKDYLRGAQFAGGAAKGEKTLLVVRMPRGLKAIVENAPESELMTLPNVKFKVGRIIKNPDVPFFDDVKWPIDRMVILEVVEPDTAIKLAAKATPKTIAKPPTPKAATPKPVVKPKAKPAVKPEPPAPKPPTTTVQKPLTLENAEQDIQEFIKQNRIAQTNEESVSKFTKLADYRSREGLDANTQRYYGTDYGKLNRSLRTGQPFHKHDAHLHDVYAAVRKDMNPLKEERLVYRGLSYKGDIRRGEEWIEDGVTSWSANSNTGVRFAHMDAKFNPDRESTLLVVRMPKGVKAIVDNKKELELTTLPDVKFKVAKVIRKPVNALDDGTENYLDAVTGHAMKADRVVILEVVEPKAVVKSALPSLSPDIPDWVKNPKSWEKSASNQYLSALLDGRSQLPGKPPIPVKVYKKFGEKKVAVVKPERAELPDIDSALSAARIESRNAREALAAVKNPEVSQIKAELSRVDEELKTLVSGQRAARVERLKAADVDDYVARVDAEGVKVIDTVDYRPFHELKSTTTNYYGDGYWVNDKLRSGYEPGGDNRKFLKDFTSDTKPLEEGHSVLRGIRSMDDFKAGDEWIEDGITSWTQSADTARKFAKIPPGTMQTKREIKSYVITTRIPKGVRAIVENYPEREITTLPDVRFKIAKIIKKPSGFPGADALVMLDVVDPEAVIKAARIRRQITELTRKSKAVVKSAPSSSIKVAPKPVVKPPAPKVPPKPAQTPDIPDWVKNPKSYEKSASNKYLAKMLKGEDDLPRQPAAVKTRALHKRSDDTLPDIDKYLDEAQVSLSATRKKMDAIKDAPELSTLKKELSEASERLKMHMDSVKNTRIARVTSDEVDDFLTKESMEVAKFERLDDYRSTNMLKVRTNDYFGTSSWDLNYYLRRGLPPKGNLKTIVKSVESDVKPLQQSHVVFRGVKDLPDNLKIGDEWIEDGVTSWSKHRSIPETYGVSSHKFGTRKDYLVVTRLPENLKAIVDHLADREIVTLPNVRYKIAKIMDAPPGVTKMDKIVFLDVVDPEAVIKAARIRRQITELTRKSNELIKKVD